MTDAKDGRDPVGNPLHDVPKDEPIRDYAATLGREYRYRPRQLVVHREDYEGIAGELQRWKAPKPVWDRTLPNIGVITLAPEVNIPAVVKRLHEVPHGPVPRVGPNHVFRGEPVYIGGPGGPRKPATRPARWSPGEKGRSVVRVGVLDTGYLEHPDLAGVDATATDADALDVPPDGLLDAQSGHGLFIAGLIRSVAPAARIQVVKGLSSHGYGDDLSIARGLLRLQKCGVVNLSLGCYTARNMEPPALVEALDRLDPSIVVVSAAGNDAQRRPFWPAALKRVIGVAALQGRKGNWKRAKFSNFGPWVDACAPGVNLRSTYVRFGAFEQWATWSGTSFAAPLVAAAIAAVSLRDGIPPAEAAFRVVGPSNPNRLPQLGAVVDPAAI